MQNAFVRWAREVSRHRKSVASFSNTRIQPPMTCISMANDEKFNLYTSFLSVSLCSFSEFWQAENAMSAQPHIRQKIVCCKQFSLYLCLDYKNQRNPPLYNLIIAKRLLEKLSSYLNVQYKVYVRCCFHITL